MNDETKKRLSHLMTVSEVKQSLRLFGTKPVYDEDSDHSEEKRSEHNK